MSGYSGNEEPSRIYGDYQGMIILAIALLILSYQSWLKYAERIASYANETFYWSVVVFAHLVLMLAFAYNIKIYIGVIRVIKEEYWG